MIIVDNTILISYYMFFFLIVISVSAVHNILNYGAVSNSSRTADAFKNAKALENAIKAANGSEDREVLVPKLLFQMMPVHVQFVQGVTITIDGTIELSEDFHQWPHPNKVCQNFLGIYDSKDLRIRGSGVIDGRGYFWWWREFLVMNQGRPHLIYFERVQNLVYEGLKLTNSPMYHIIGVDIDSFVFQDFEIYVDIYKQKSLFEEFGKWDLVSKIPTFPLNTDGIDPAGTNVWIRNVTITMYDDAVAVKPSDQRGTIAKCSSNILVENCTVWMGVGMTIGSVPPNDHYACVKDVYFRNITMHYPYKAIYVKTNPGEGLGLISNITYLDFEINFPIWWGIYIGPQQQKQPDGDGPGCMLYPIFPVCPTQPRVTVQDITLKNIHVKGSLLTPGIIRCHESNPCKRFHFENVVHEAWYNLLKLNFIVENVEGVTIGCHPSPEFKLPA